MHHIRLTGLLLVAIISLVGLTGCATRSSNMYQWGSYETQVYNYFNNGTSPEIQIAELEKTLQTAPAGTRPVPPGFHAHLGLLYGQVGRFSDMQIQFESEKALYPESTAFMDFLLRKQKKSNGVKS